MAPKKTMIDMMMILPQRGTLRLGNFDEDEGGGPSGACSDLEVSGGKSSHSSFISNNINLGFVRGQVVLEYVLLLLVAFSVSIIIMSRLVGSHGEPNGIRLVWLQLIQTIGADIPGN